MLLAIVGRDGIPEEWAVHLPSLPCGRVEIAGGESGRRAVDYVTHMRDLLLAPFVAAAHPVGEGKRSNPTNDQKQRHHRLVSALADGGRTERAENSRTVG